MLKNSEFFNQLADDYNVMIDFENSLKNKIATLTNFCSNNNPTVNKTNMIPVVSYDLPRQHFLKPSRE